MCNTSESKSQLIICWYFTYLHQEDRGEAEHISGKNVPPVVPAVGDAWHRRHRCEADVEHDAADLPDDAVDAFQRRMTQQIHLELSQGYCQYLSRQSALD